MIETSWFFIKEWEQKGMFLVHNHMKRENRAYRGCFGLLASLLGLSLIFSPAMGYAQGLFLTNLPVPGTMVLLSPHSSFAFLRGVQVNPDNPLEFNFILENSDPALAAGSLKKESRRLIKYFLAGLTIPQEDLWVNLSPYENDRVTSESLGQTEMGRDLLSQDYLLKQLSASLMYPEKELGKEFWQRIYERAYEEFGTTNIPVNTFNKVWIVPEVARVHENGHTAFVVGAHLKVMLEEDYLALEKNKAKPEWGTDSLDNREVSQVSALSSRIVREVILPVIEEEVNSGENFIHLRQMYYSLILAAWYKTRLRHSILNQVYADQGKIAGVDVADKAVKEKIYEQYLQALQKGVFDFIKEDEDFAGDEPVARRYFSGGAPLGKVFDVLDVGAGRAGELRITGNLENIQVVLKQRFSPEAREQRNRAIEEVLEQIGLELGIERDEDGVFGFRSFVEKNGRPDALGPIVRISEERYLRLREDGFLEIVDPRFVGLNHFGEQYGLSVYAENEIEALHERVEWESWADFMVQEEIMTPMEIQALRAGQRGARTISQAIDQAANIEGTKEDQEIYRRKFMEQYDRAHLKAIGEQIRAAGAQNAEEEIERLSHEQENYQPSWSQSRLNELFGQFQPVWASKGKRTARNKDTEKQVAGVATERQGHSGFQVGGNIDISQRWLNLQESFIAQIYIENRVLPDTHPAVEYLNGLLQGLVLDHPARVHILKSDEVEGFASATGDIFISTQAVKDLMTTREAAQALLMHELTHIEQGHARQRSWQKADPLFNVGLTRYFEFEADVAMLTALDRRGVNPIGALQLSANLAQVVSSKRPKVEREIQRNIPGKDQASVKWRKIAMLTYDVDLTHGTANQRKSNLRELIRFLNLRNLKEERHPIDWKSMDIEYKVGIELQSADVAQMTPKEFLITVAFRHAHGKPYKKIIADFIAQRGIKLKKPEQDLVNFIFDSFILSGTEVSALSNVQAFAPDVVEAILRKNVFEQIGIPFSPQQYLKILQATSRRFFAGQDISQLVTNMDALKEVVGLIQQMFKQRYSGEASFLASLNSILLAEYLIRYAVGGKTNYEISEKLFRGTPIPQLQILGDIPFEASHLDIFEEFIKTFRLGVFDFESTIKRILEELELDKAISPDYHIQVEAQDMFKLDGFLARLSSFFDLTAKQLASELKEEETQNIFVRTLFLANMINPDYFNRWIDSSPKGLAALYQVKTGEYYALESTSLEVIVTEPFRAMLIKNFKTIGGLSSMDTRPLLQDTVSHIRPEQGQENSFQELMQLCGNYLIEIGLREGKKFSDEPDDVEIVRDFETLKKLFLYFLYSEANKQAFWDRVDKYIKIYFEDVLKKEEDDEADQINGLAFAEKVRSWLQDIIAEHDQSGFRPAYGFTKQDLIHLSALLPLVKRDVLEDYNLSGTADDVMQRAVDLADKFPLAFVSIEQKAFDEHWARLSNGLNGKLKPRSSFPETAQDFESILAMALLSQGNLANVTVISTSFKEMIRRSPDFRTAFDLLKKYSFLPRNFVQEALQVVLQEQAKTLEELEEVYQWSREELSRFLKAGYKIATLEVIQSGFRFLDKGDRLEFLKKALTTSQSDAEFKEFMARKWWQVLSSRLLDQTNIEDVLFSSFFGEKQENEEKLGNAIQAVVSEPKQVEGVDNTFFSNLYPTFFRLDAVSVYLLFRALALEGDDALFKSREAKEELVDYVINNYIRMSSSPDAQKIAHELRSVIAEDLDAEDLFYFLGPSLAAMAFQIPRDVMPDDDIVSQIFSDFLLNPPAELESKYTAYFKEPWKFKKTSRLIMLRIRTYVTGVVPSEEEVEKLLAVADEDTSDVLKSMRKAFEPFENAMLARLSPYIEPRKTFSQQMRPIELSVEISKQVGGMMVLMLQLAGMYFDLSVEDREAVAEVFDSVQGQNKLQFYANLKGLAENNPQFNTLFQKIRQVGDMLGGGSVVTVYAVEDQDGKEWAVGGNNPNITFMTSELKRFADRILDGLINRDPQNKYYHALKQILQNAYRWKLDEVNDPDYHRKNAAFIEQNDHRSTSPRRFESAPGMVQQLMVPEVVDTGTQDIRWETRVRGRSLNDLLVEYRRAKQDGDSEKVRTLGPIVKGAVAQIGQNFVHQMDQRLAHPDIHPGQFIVMDEQGEIAYLDRKNLLEFTAEDIDAGKEFLKTILKGFRPSRQQGNEILVSFIRTFQDAQLPDQEALEKLQKDLAQKIQDKSPEEIIQNILWSLQQENINIPFKWVLVMYNLIKLNRMAREAGFAHLGEMLLYQPKDPDAKADAADILKTARRLAPHLTRELIKDEVIAQLKGKGLKDFFKNSQVVTTIKEKTKGLLARIRRTRIRTVSKDVKDRVNQWFSALESLATFSISEEARRFGLHEEELKEILGYGIIQIEGAKDKYGKTNSLGAAGADLKEIDAGGRKREEGDPLGGIDLNSLLDKMRIEGQGPEVIFEPQVIQELQIDGFSPVIINISPVLNLPLLLGQDVEFPGHNT